MLDAAQEIIDFTSGQTRQDLTKDRKLNLAVVRLLEIVGEAARSVSPELRNNHPELPWKQMAGTRDRLVHGYFDVDLESCGK
jgi:uncharacterized protein with HEPN domain